MEHNKTSEKILVIKLSAFGDFIQALGPMAAIRRHHPKAHITLLTTKTFLELGKRCGYFDDVQCDIRPKIFDLNGWLNLRNFLNTGRFTRVYDLQNNDRTSFYLRLFSRQNKPEWVGAAVGASHRNASAQRTFGHALEGHVQTLNMAGVQNIEIDNLSWIKEDLSAFEIQKPYILLVPGSAPQHPHKRWPAEKYAALALLLQEKGYQSVLLGTNAEADVTAKIKSFCPAAIDLTGRTSLFQIAALGQAASGTVGNDTGPMHMIAPTGCPCVVLFSGSSIPKRHAPRGKTVTVLQENDLKDLNVDEVAAEALRVFAPNTNAQPSS